MFCKRIHNDLINGKIDTQMAAQCPEQSTKYWYSPKHEVSNKVFPTKIFPDTSLTYDQFPHVSRFSR